MHPEVRRDKAGSCPICGMALVALSDAEQRAPTEVHLSERARALAKLRTTVVRRRSGGPQNLELVGQVDFDETTLKTVTAWTAGRIDRLQVATTGQRVKAGQTVARLFSPEVFSAQQDLIVALGQAKDLEEGASKVAAYAALEAARARLRLLGVPNSEIEGLERSGEGPTRTVAIRSPFSGTVLERLATEGAYVKTGTPLYRIGTLASVWVQLEAYENDLPRLASGQSVLVKVEALEDPPFKGKVTFIDPVIDPQRRTARVRVEVQNRGGRLKPGMFVKATVSTPPERVQRLSIPETAPLFTGRRSLVYVETGRKEGTWRYEPRVVRLGPKTAEGYPVVAGLDEGEIVVTRGAFVLDADLQIRGGPSMMNRPLREETVLPPQERPGQRVLSLLEPVVSSYLVLQTALADDALEPARQAAAHMTVQLRKSRTSVDAPSWTRLSKEMAKQATRVRAAKSLESARLGFEALSQSAMQLLRQFGNPTDRPIRLAYCPMAAGSDGAYWLQASEDVDNAYFGKSMLTCGEIREEVPPGRSLETANF